MARVAAQLWRTSLIRTGHPGTRAFLRFSENTTIPLSVRLHHCAVCAMAATDIRSPTLVLVHVCQRLQFHPIVPLNTPVCTNYTAGKTQIVACNPVPRCSSHANITCSSCLEGPMCTPQPGWLANCGTCIDGTCVANSLDPAIYPGDGDADGDFVPDACDNCPYVWNPSQNESSCNAASRFLVTDLCLV